MDVVVVESPAKAKTINKYLGKNYTVKASVGHVMDLPAKVIGIRLPIDEDEINKKKKKRKSKKGAKPAAAKPLKPISLDDPKIFVVTAAHRGPAFEACRWIIDTLKKTVPIWKKEYFEDGAVWADGEAFPEEITRLIDTTGQQPASK